jgi:hypothetical protein
MTGLIADRLDAERRAMFVGRRDELTAIERLLDRRGGVHFLYLTGPGGIGKTELLRAAARQAADADFAVVTLDGRDRAWTADDIEAALLDACAARATLVVFDTFEAAAHLESAWRARCLPRLPDHARVIAAGRTRLSSMWSEDPGWWRLARQIEVGPLTVGESEELLRRRGIPGERARGYAAQIPAHPLSLALFAEILLRDADSSPRFDDNRSIARALVERLLIGLSTAEREMLEAAALVPVVTLDILESMLEGADPAAFATLRAWSFVSPHRDGLRVHDVVRSAVAADLAWRDSRRRAALLHRAARHYLHRWPQRLTTEADAATVIAGCRVLVHAQPQQVLGDERDDVAVVAAAPEAWVEIEAMVARHEGPQSLEALRYWREQGADCFVVTSDDDRVLGFLSVVHLEGVTEAQAARDPGTLPLWRAWHAAGVLDTRRGHFVRHWMAAEVYQALSTVQAAVVVKICEYLASPDTAAMAQSFADIAFYSQFLAEFSPRHMPECDFIQDGRAHGILGRTYEISAADSLRHYLAGAADLWQQAALGQPAAAAANQVRFDRARFEAAVREALRACDRLDVLESARLRTSGWTAERTGRRGAVRQEAEALRDLLRDESRRLFASPRDAVLDRVIEATFFRPGPKQRAIAAELGLSYGTYRRHVGNATRRLVDSLWSREAATRNAVALTSRGRRRARR